jgi:predicted amidophosphoribosyltransferase
MKINSEPRDCCTGSSPCPRKPLPLLPGAVAREGAIFCRYCWSRLNKKTPPICPVCGKDLTA